jgi:hypothetical protein
MMPATKGWAIGWLFVLGAIVGTGLDAFHVHSGVERYAVPVLLGLAWWVPLLFGTASVAVGYSHALVDPLLGQRRVPRQFVLCMVDLMWVVLAYLVSATSVDSVGKVGLMTVIYLNFWFVTGRGWQNLVLSGVTAITGTLVEMMLVAGGAFSYLHPDFIGVPYWLPCTYACASLAVGDMGRYLILSPRTRGFA